MLTPTEICRAELRYDAQLDCSPDELAGRRRQREADRACCESVRRHHRWLDLSPASKAELERRTFARLDAERDAAERAILLKNPLAVTADDLDMLPFRDRLQVETKIMMARHQEQTKLLNFPGPNNVPPPAPRMQTAADLQRKTFAPVHYVVPGFIGEGLTIFAGRPKVGKSWLALDAVLAVASGTDVLGRKVEQGDVLALMLEDNERRLKTRIQKIVGPFAEWPSRFTYATEWPRVDEGGLDKIRAWIKSVSQPRLIVVDVLARVRSQQQGRQAQYEADYQAIAGLQAIASEHRVAIVVVHHLRKSGSESGDAIDKISGTLGLSGAADSLLVIDRDGAGITLYGRGRDIEEIEAAVEFDRADCRWRVLGKAAEVRRSDERKAILDALMATGASMSPADLAAATGMPSNNVRYLLFRMVRDGQITKAGRGYVPCNAANATNALTPSQRIVLPPPPY